MRRIAFILAVLTVSCSLGVAADDPIKELRQQVGEFQKAIDALNARIDTLEGENKALREQQQGIKEDGAAMPAVQPPPPPPPPSRRIGSVNPDIGILIDTLGTLSDQRPSDSFEDDGLDRFSVREVELNIGHDIDPFTRFQATITFSDAESVDIEEAYVLYTHLPKGFQGRAGRFRLPVGLSNPFHQDQLFTVDEPLVIRRYLGGEGIFKSGLELSRFLPTINDKLTQDVRFGVVGGGSGAEGTLFGNSRQRPTYFARLRSVLDISPTDNLSFGTSFLAGSSGVGSPTDAQAIGLDIQYAHFFTPVQKLTLQAESLQQFRTTSITRSAKTNPFGYYLLADMRLNSSWGFGGRFGQAEVADYDPTFPIEPTDFRIPNRDRTETSYAIWATFFQSEFARWRLQLEHTDLASGADDDRLMLQGTFTVGWHQHAVQ